MSNKTKGATSKTRRSRGGLPSGAKEPGAAGREGDPPRRGAASDAESGTARTPPLSIAMLAPCPFPTHQGTQVLIRHLATALARAGHQVHLITYGYGEYEESFAFHMHRAPRVDAGLRSGPSLLKPAADTALALTAARVARAYRCDLWHVHNVEGLGIGALLKLQTGLPLVYHAHNAMGPELPTYFRAHLAQAFASLVGDVLDRTLPRAADAVITFDADHKALHELYGVPEQTLHIIPPGLDPDIANPDPAEVARLRARLGPGPLLLYAGNPDNYQNLPLLWRALPLLRAARPDVRLLVATNHPASAFAAGLREAGSPDGVVLQRYEGIEELRALFAVAEIGVSPRTLWTGAPIKVLDYMAAGLQVLACRSGARHIVTPASGLLVDETPEAFAQGALRLLDHPVGTPEKRRRVFDRYRIDRQIPRYEAVYRQVLDASQPAPVSTGGSSGDPRH